MKCLDHLWVTSHFYWLSVVLLMKFWLSNLICSQKEGCIFPFHQYLGLFLGTSFWQHATGLIFCELSEKIKPSPIIEAHSAPTSNNKACLGLAASWIGSACLFLHLSPADLMWHCQQAGWACPRQLEVEEEECGARATGQSLCLSPRPPISLFSSKSSEWLVLLIWEWVKVIQLRPALCNSMDYTVHRILQAKILEWVGFYFSRRSSQPRSPILQVDSLLDEPQGKPSNTGVGSLSLLQQIFLTQESN